MKLILGIVTLSLLYFNSLASLFDSLQMTTLGRTMTNECAMECFDYFSYSVYYSIYNDNGYCCKSSYKLFVTECTVGSTTASNSSKSMKTDVMKYVLCSRDQGKCGAATNLTITSQFTSVTAEGFKYGDNNYCYYFIYLSATESALYDYVQIYVDYFFASSLYIVNGYDIYYASNKTTASIGSYYYIPTLNSSNGVNTIYIISVPDKTDTVNMQLKFSYRLYSGAVDLVASSSFDSTLSDPGNTIDLSVRDFALICSLGGVGAIGLSILLAWTFNMIQYRTCPPKSWEKKMQELKQQEYDEEHYQPTKKKKNDYDNTLEEEYRRTTPPQPKTKKKPSKK